MKTMFHLSLPCRDVEETKIFYLNNLQADLGRNTNNWVDINLFGNQITFTKSGDFNFEFNNYRLEENILPSFHFGVIVDVEKFGELYSILLKKEENLSIKNTFMKDKIGEHLSFFVKDPNGYMIEFKCFKKQDEVFRVN